ncbi:MAG TPA: DOMON-like domain-containing protein [Steroidobacteraceae bacterium]|nr:DOMON-like domain-containing protein [Steroidobacteraceae bacterium]
MSTDFGRHRLLPHPDTDAVVIQDLVEDLSVDVTRLNGKLVLLYRLTADPQALRLPEPRPAARIDGLWRHTCFEAFIRHGDASEYWEYNFSPSGAWAAYHFTAYREGMAPLVKGAPPMLRLHTGADDLQLEVTVDLSWLARAPSGDGLRLGLSAVIEDRAQVLSYWALKHPFGKPDFHHADGFAIDLG